MIPEKLYISRFRLRGFKCPCGYYMEVFGPISQNQKCCACCCALEKPTFDIIVRTVKTSEPFECGNPDMAEFEDKIDAQ